MQSNFAKRPIKPAATNGTFIATLLIKLMQGFLVHVLNEAVRRCHFSRIYRFDSVSSQKQSLNFANSNLCNVFNSE